MSSSVLIALKDSRIQLDLGALQFLALQHDTRLTVTAACRERYGHGSVRLCDFPPRIVQVVMVFTAMGDFLA
jgi:hypothetical protein